jgi:predicted phosphodiesterase
MARNDPYRWPPERRAEVEVALRSSRNREEAARKLDGGIGIGSLDHACRAYGFKPSALLARRPAPSLGGAASYVDPGPAVHIEPREALASVAWTGARPTSSGIGLERRIIIGDVHIPVHLASALRCVYALIAALQPHKVIQIGDLVNSEAFTRHAPSTPEGERYDLSMLAARGFIRNVKRAAPGAELYIIRGNHDDWASRYETENPGLVGSFDFEEKLGLKSLPDDDRPPMFEGVHVVRHAEENPLVLGPVAYAHGNGGGIHFAKRYAENNGPRTGVRVMRVGHHHTLQVFNHRNGIECWGVGWVGDERQPAFKYAPPPRSWWVGIVVEDIIGDHVTTTPVPIVNGAALFGGRLIAPEPEALAA